MKSIIRTAFGAAFILLGGALSAQNNLPVLSNLQLVADTSQDMVTITYDVSDAESDPLEVWIQASADGGATWRVAIDSLTGDFGFPIAPGTGKTLQWHYNPASLIPYGPSGLANYVVRLVADDRQPVDLQLVTDMVDSTRLHNDLLALQGIRHRTAGLQKLSDTKDSLEQHMADFDLHPYRQGSSFGNYVCQNLIGRRSGTRRDSACWQISSHFDTVYDSPGGDDNGTAVACVSEAIRVLSNFQTKESLRFFYFDLEEDGLIGSAQYVNSAIPGWEEPKGLLNMDCVGVYKDTPNSQVMPFGFNILFPAAYAAVEADSFRGNFLTSIVNTASSWMDTVFRSTAATHVPSLKVITLETPGVGLTTVDLRRSDHAPFWDRGYPAIFFSDGANFRNTNYHTANDSVQWLNMLFYIKNVRAIVTTLARLAQLEHSDVAVAGNFDLTIPVGVQEAPALRPRLQVTPTPTDGKVAFRMELPQAGDVRLEIRNHHGNLVRVVHAGWLAAGSHVLPWQAELSQGIYAVYLTTASGNDYQPLVIQR